MMMFSTNNILRCLLVGQSFFLVFHFNCKFKYLKRPKTSGVEVSFNTKNFRPQKQNDFPSRYVCLVVVLFLVFYLLT